MKRESRAVYLELGNEIDAELCSFCKYHDSKRCCSGTCSIPLPVPKWATDMYPGDDCWGFRPVMPVSDMADIVGLVLANGWVAWRYSFGEKQLTVSGTTRFA